MRYFLFVLWSASALFVLIAHFDDVKWKAEEVWEALPFNKSKPRRPVAHLNIEGAGGVLSNNIAVMIYPGDAPRSVVGVLQSESATLAEKQKRSGFVYLPADPLRPGEVAFYANCRVATANLIVAPDGEVSGAPLFSERTFISGIAPFGAADRPMIIIVFADEDTNGDGALGCEDKATLGIFDVDAGELTITDAVLEDASPMMNKIAANRVLVSVGRGSDQPPVIVDVFTGEAGPILSDEMQQRIEAALSGSGSK